MRQIEPGSQAAQLLVHYVRERHAIYVRRTQGDPPPWTQDPWLGHVRFPNVYRTLDPGTRFVLEQLFSYRGNHWTHLAWNLMTYRLMGTREAAWAGGFTDPTQPFPREEWLDRLRASDRLGLRLFTGAYRVAGYQWAGSSCKLEAVANLFRDTLRNWGQISERMTAAESPPELHRAICSARGWGPFLAWQVLLDLSMLHGHPTRKGDVLQHPPAAGTGDEWAVLGASARRGMALLYGTEVPHAFLHPAAREVQKLLTDSMRHQKASRPLTLADSVHVLRSFSQYWDVRVGGIRPRRRFDPLAAWQLSKWARGHGSQLDWTGPDMTPEA